MAFDPPWQIWRKNNQNGSYQLPSVNCLCWDNFLWKALFSKSFEMQDENMEQQGPRGEKQGEIAVKVIHHEIAGDQEPMHYRFWKSNMDIFFSCNWTPEQSSDCDIKVFLEEWLTDYRAKLMRKCKLLLKVQFVCLRCCLSPATCFCIKQLNIN